MQLCLDNINLFEDKGMQLIPIITAVYDEKYSLWPQYLPTPVYMAI